MLKQLYQFLHPKYQNVFLDYKVDLLPRYGHGKPAHQELLKIIEAGRNNYKEILQKALLYKEFIQQIKDIKAETDARQPVWNNGFLPGLDIIGLYIMLSMAKPGKYIEIGSGSSTKVASKTIKDQHLSTKIISIDPMPRTEINDLADKIIRQPLETVSWDIAGELHENDILFVDNSHRILPNSDSTVFFMEILPKLRKGVYVHIHDVYLPYDYPPFMCKRAYSEQYGLAINLLARPERYETVFPAWYISEDEKLSSLIASVWDHPNLRNVERHGGSYWVRINE